MKKGLGCSVLVLFVAACGREPPQLGVAIDEVGLERRRVGDPAADPTAGIVGTPLATRRVWQADVLGDDRLDEIWVARDGHAVEIRDGTSSQVTSIPSPEYVTDVGALPATGGEKSDLVLYTYPKPGGGGTFRVVTADRRERARWDATPPPGGFAVGVWRAAAAVFYFQDDALVAHASDGRLLIRASTKGARPFRVIRSVSLPSERVVVLASGDGYTPYHMVCIYDPDGRLRYQEFRDEHAFDLEREPKGDAFVVTTRSGRWEYASKGGVGR
jgi:hypothetical protein